MPTYKVSDPTTGKSVSLTGDSPPTEQELHEIFSQVHGTPAPNFGTGPQSAPTDKPTVAPWKQAVSNIARPVLEYGGMLAGGVAGTAAGAAGGGVSVPVVGAIPGGLAGGVAGEALGYAGGKQAANALDTKLGLYQPKGVVLELAGAAKDVGTGAAYSMAGQLLYPALAAAGKPIAAIAKQMLGATTGAGPGAVEEAVKGSPDFMKAMRGQTTGEEVVDNARTALQAIRGQRGDAYRGILEKITASNPELDAAPIKSKLQDLMDRFNVKVATPQKEVPTGLYDQFGTGINTLKPGKPITDTSRIAMGSAGRKDIQDIIKTVNGWGSKPGDNTALGLDTLKRQLDDFYSDSSQARAFVASMRKEVHDTISKNVPQYAEMTKGYSEAISLIKDIESNLMMKKGQVPDQTLRRLTSAMRENFEMRRDLVNALGAQSGQDIPGQVAGYSMNQMIPRGLVGKLAGGGMGYLAMLNPKFWPLLASSSPRAVGEFLSVFGKAASRVPKPSAPMVEAVTKGALVSSGEKPKRRIVGYEE